MSFRPRERPVVAECNQCGELIHFYHGDDYKPCENCGWNGIEYVRGKPGEFPGAPKEEVASDDD